MEVQAKAVGSSCAVRAGQTLPGSRVQAAQATDGGAGGFGGGGGALANETGIAKMVRGALCYLLFFICKSEADVKAKRLSLVLPRL